MAEKSSEINFERKPLPSGPGAQQITVEGCESKKGGQEFVSDMPKKFVVPGGDKKK